MALAWSLWAMWPINPPTLTSTQRVRMGPSKVAAQQSVTAWGDMDADLGQRGVGGPRTGELGVPGAGVLTAFVPGRGWDW